MTRWFAVLVFVAAVACTVAGEFVGPPTAASWYLQQRLPEQDRLRQAAYATITVGMSEAQVVALMGAQPDDVVKSVWSYYLSQAANTRDQADWVLTFRVIDHRVTNKQQSCTHICQLFED